MSGRDPSRGAAGEPPGEEDPGEIRGPDTAPEEPEPSPFRHPPWMVGVVAILGVMALLGGFENPLWWLMGSPFILALAIYLWVRLWPRG